jgi:hypothetical protein
VIIINLRHQKEEGHILEGTYSIWRRFFIFHLFNL